MKIGVADVERAAAAARITLDEGAAATIAAELAPVAALLAGLRHVRAERSGGAVGVGAGGMPLRADAGPAYDLARPLREIAPASRAGFVLVPRLPGAPAPAANGAGARDGAAAPFDDVVGDDAFAAEMELGA